MVLALDNAARLLSPYLTNRILVVQKSSAVNFHHEAVSGQNDINRSKTFGIDINATAGPCNVLVALFYVGSRSSSNHYI